MSFRCSVFADGRLSEVNVSFEAVPRVGEFITIMYEHDVTRFRVDRVEHGPASVHASGEPKIHLHVSRP